MSRIPACLEDVQHTIQALQKHIEILKEQNKDLDSTSRENLGMMSAQVEMLKEIENKYQVSLESTHTPEMLTPEKVLRSFVISKTIVDVLEQTRQTMKAKLTYGGQSGIAMTELDSEGRALLVPPFSLPLFIPNYIQKFSFESLKEIIQAVAQVLEAYWRRLESVKMFEEQYSEMLLRKCVEKDYACTCVELEMSISSPSDDFTLMKLRLLYPLDDVRAEKVYVTVTGSEEVALLEETRQKANVFRQYPFLKAFQKFIFR